MLIKLFTIYVYLQTALCGCGPDKRNSDFVRLRKDYKVKMEKISQLDKRMTESSGLARATDSTFYTHADGGQLNQLYQFNVQGELLQTIDLPIPNQDWEDLAQDEQGKLYIGDFGNNANRRRDQKVYTISQSTMQVKDTLAFSFADQAEFPPPLKRQHYDLEAFFHHNDSLYLFTKSRSLKPVTQLYKLPVSGAETKLQPIARLRLKSPVTGADISPNDSAFALLGYGRLYLFEPDNAIINLNGKRYCLPLGRTGQAEAVLFLKPNQLLITNENGKLFRVTYQPK